MNGLACGLAITLAVTLVGPGTQDTRQYETVIQDDALLLHRPAPAVRLAAQRMADLGADRARITASWSELAPRSDASRRPEFDASNSRAYPDGGFARLDRAVKEVRRAGMDVMIDVAFFAPRWAVRRRAVNGRGPWRPNPREFALFTRAVAERYDGNFPDPLERRGQLPAVRLWTTWNEPNHPTFLMPQWERGRARRGVFSYTPARAAARGKSRRRQRPRSTRPWVPASPHIYRRMHELAYRELKAVDSANKVLLGGTAAHAESGRGARKGIGPLRFTRELACVDGRLRPLRRRPCHGFKPLRADGFAHHPYSRYTRPDERSERSDRVQIGELDKLTGLLGALERSGRLAQPLPLYVTEYGYETNPPDPRSPSERDAARYLGEATWLAFSRPEVRMFAQFLLQDIGPDPSQTADSGERWADYQTGLYDHDGKLKPEVAAGFKLPFWATAVEDEHGFTEVLAFGQVRPGRGPQRVVLQQLVSGGRWANFPTLPVLAAPSEGCGDFTTDSRGFYEREFPYSPGKTYRAAWRRADGRYEFSPTVTLGQPRRILGGIAGMLGATKP